MEGLPDPERKAVAVREAEVSTRARYVGACKRRVRFQEEYWLLSESS